MKKIRLLLFALVAGLAVGAAGAHPTPSAYVLPGATVFPEGIDFWPRTGEFFVSSTGDGSVLRGELGNPTASPAFVAPTGTAFSAIGVAVDRQRELLAIAGGPTGTVRVADAHTGAVLRTFTSGPGGFLNDLAVADGGDVFVTDSFRPTLWRIPAGAPAGALEPWLSFVNSPITYTAGFNPNGIVQTENGRFLIVVQSSTGKLFRIDLATKAIQEIDLGGAAVPGDGMEIHGKLLYVEAAGQIVKIRLAQGYGSGEVLSQTTDPSWLSPTTIALARGRLLIVNSQFASLGGTPILPFTVASIPAP